MINDAMNDLKLLPQLANCESHSELVQKLAQAMAHNIEIELAEIDKLDIVLSLTNSPVLINQILNDDPYFCFTKSSLQGRLSVAKQRARANMFEKYWNYFFERTSKKYYPSHIHNHIHKHYFTKYSSIGTSYIDFNLENVEYFVTHYVLQPYSIETAISLLKFAQKFISIQNGEVHIQPFMQHFNDFNRPINAKDVVSAILFLQHGEERGWLLTSLSTKTCFDRIVNAKYFYITCDEDEFKIGANFSDKKYTALVCQHLNIIDHA